MDKELILRVYGDSRSKPSYKRGVTIKDTWEEQLKSMFEEQGIKVYLNDKSFGGKSIKFLYETFNNDRKYFGESNGVVIFFFGIVDCAPRPVHPFVRWIISNISHTIRNKIVEFLHNHRTEILKIKYYQEAPIKVFKKYYTRMVKRTIEHNEVFCIGIGPVAQELKDRAFGIEKEMAKYNSFIKALTDEYQNGHYVDLPELLTKKIKENGNTDDEIYVGDGHHFTHLGHKYIAEILYDLLSEALKN